MKERRWAHLLAGEPKEEASSESDAASAAPALRDDDASRVERLEREMTALREELTALREAFEEFRRQFQ